MVSYFSQGRPKDTLEIISRTLGFNDEERKRVGLRALHDDSGGGQSGLLGGLFSKVGAVISSPRKEFHPEDSEGKSLGDLWFDYLMNETEEPPPPAILAPDLDAIPLDGSIGGGGAAAPARVRVGGGNGSVDTLSVSR